MEELDARPVPIPPAHRPSRNRFISAQRKRAVARGGCSFFGFGRVATTWACGYDHAVRLVCFGDIHMALPAIERLGPTLREADWAILTGDLTNFGDPPDAARVIDAVRAHCPAVLAVTGNLDMPWVIDALAARGISLHGEARRLGGLGVFGCGGSNVTPMDTPTELEEDELRAVLERAHAGVADAPRRLMVCHTPPFDTRLDRLRNGTPVGSPAVRTFIESARPDLAVVGHIHEGRGIDRVGDTTVVNPGALRDGGYAVVEYDEARDTISAELGHLRTRIVL